MVNALIGDVKAKLVSVSEMIYVINIHHFRKMCNF
jgi:hypothetical protein